MKYRFIKYEQIVNFILEKIESKELLLNDQLPSLFNLVDKFQVSRDTVIKAYKELQVRGAIKAYPGKGYFVARTDVERKKNIFMLFDVFTPYKEVLYNSFLRTLKHHGTVELYFHNYNPSLFENLLTDNAGKYTDYVIMPILDKKSIELIAQHSKNNKVYILDTGWRQIGNKFPSVCQDFKTGISNALNQGLDKLKKYSEIIMVLKPPANYSEKQMIKEMKEGFTSFCEKHRLHYEVHEELTIKSTKKGICYILHDDNDLITLVEFMNNHQLKIADKIGIISYNDTPLKKVVKNGITTISTNFEEMGSSMAHLILAGKKESILNTSGLILRNSI